MKLAKVSGKGGKVCAWVTFSRLCFGSTIATERHRSRTCLASGYDAVLVLKTSWGTGPSRSAADTNWTR
jgi:hypothetical protein